MGDNKLACSFLPCLLALILEYGVVQVLLPIVHDDLRLLHFVKDAQDSPTKEALCSRRSLGQYRGGMEVTILPVSSSLVSWH